MCLAGPAAIQGNKTLKGAGEWSLPRLGQEVASVNLRHGRGDEQNRLKAGEPHLAVGGADAQF